MELIQLDLILNISPIININISYRAEYAKLIGDRVLFLNPDMVSQNSQLILESIIGTRDGACCTNNCVICLQS